MYDFQGCYDKCVLYISGFSFDILGQVSFIFLLEINSPLEVQYRNISIFGSRFYAEIKKTTTAEWEADKPLAWT